MTMLNPAAIAVEEGFVDVTFPIERHERLIDGTVSVLAHGTLNDIEIGFIVELLPDWKRQKVENPDLVLYWGRARYRSLGKPSDRFLHILVEQYGLPGRDRRMAAIIEFTAVCFQTDPRELDSSPITMKLFFEPGPKEAYAEVFTNIDVVGGLIEFREKDPEYRGPLVDALDYAGNR